MEGNKPLHSSTGTPRFGYIDNGQSRITQHVNENSNYSYRVGVSGRKKVIFTSMSGVFE
jgi:hypothetical protein